MQCAICEKKATKRFSPDLDIQGIGTCDKHLKDVMVGYVLLLQGSKKEYFNYMKGLRIKAKS
ncbi:MAG: hypothetical protein KGI58_03990 [Patescibacteria group bacterium]|nr:hypothetical protein [Patescibacteria group bacterium]